MPGVSGSDTASSRLTDASVGGLIYQTAVRIPLGTALFEELLFRGLLYGAFLRVSGHRGAILGSSAVFGVWHVRPTHDLLTETGTLTAEWAMGLAIAHGLINSLSATAAHLSA